ncbi:MAG TPA: chorismate pyruvate-lyase family protein [Bryobacteraceae bacterium]|jgi:chorismate-pyruvate lyase
MSRSEVVSIGNAMAAFAWPGRGCDCTQPGSLQRLLLAADGTLTDMLEALYQEELQVVLLKQHIAPVGQRPEFNLLYVSPAEPALTRTVTIQGVSSGRAYVYAESCIALNRLDPRVRRGLLKTDIGIGRLWKMNRIETYKEVLESGIEAARFLSCRFDVHPDDPLLLRRCRVSSGGKPVALLTEYVRCPTN